MNPPEIRISRPESFSSVYKKPHYLATKKPILPKPQRSSHFVARGLGYPSLDYPGLDYPSLDRAAP
jgi:hypothetical protein